MYADKVTDSVYLAMDETLRCRTIRQRYNGGHGIVPKTTIKEIRGLISITEESEDDIKEAVQVSYEEMTKEEKDTLLMKLEKEVKGAAKVLDFETAANVRNMTLELGASKQKDNVVNDKITIHGVRVHNLRNINVTIPRDKFVVVTGLSGSGKSSLAFDTLYAEGQRRYVESLSAYARQFLGQIDKPDIDSIDGLSPTISIDQKTTSKNPCSTVGIVTEISDYLRLLSARVGHPICPDNHVEITSQSVDQMADQVMVLSKRIKIQVTALIVVKKKDQYKKIFERI